MADRPKISIKTRAVAPNPHRRPVRPGAPHRPAPPPDPARRDGPARPERGARPDRPPRPDRTDRPPRPDRPATTGRPPNPERPAGPAGPRPQRTAPLRPTVPKAEAAAPAAPAAPDKRPAPANPALGVRISKLMTERGLSSRREADDWIAAGWVRVAGKMAVLGQRVAADTAIDIDPRARAMQARLVTVLIHKPIGIVSGQAEDGYEPAITLVTPANRWPGDGSRIDFHPAQLRSLAPAGRLDIDSTGLLVLTQDGRIAKLLIGDETRVEKEYLVRVAPLDGQPVPEATLDRLRHGLELDGQPLRPARVSWQNEEQLRVVLREGRKRQIRRMCELVGLQVLGLKRVRIGSVALGPLPPGQWRYLADHERFI